MGVIDMGGILVHGNFEEVLQEKPKDFHYDRDSKWIERYSESGIEWREKLGNAICSCINIEVNYAPYYGFEFYHQETCSLMRKIRAEPQIQNLREIYLPQMNQWHDSILDDGKLHIWVENITKRAKRIKVNVNNTDINQVTIF